jgi:hypothetical protein
MLSVADYFYQIENTVVMFFIAQNYAADENFQCQPQQRILRHSIHPVAKRFHENRRPWQERAIGCAIFEEDQAVGARLWSLN